jgi:hypothetical protein
MNIKESLSRLNGWRRLWLVGSILGLLYALVWGQNVGDFYSFPKDAVRTGFKNPECAHIVAMPAGTEPKDRPNGTSPCWELYLYRSIYKDAANTAEGYVEHWTSLQTSRLLEKTGAGLLMWAIGISLTYFVGWVVAWVIGGFRKPPAA